MNKESHTSRHAANEERTRRTPTAAEQAAQRLPRPTGWPANSAWWLGKGRVSEDGAWENAPTFTMTEHSGSVLSDWTNITPLPLLRGCTQAFSHPDSAALALSTFSGRASLLADEQYRKLVNDLTSGCADKFPVALPKPDLLVIFYRYALLGGEEQRTWQDAAAATAGDVVRNAVATRDCTWPTLQLALNVLLLLPPSTSITQHEAVAALLNDSDELPTVLTYAAHTLACMGPQAVAEHYEEIMSIARAGGECVAAAWLCVCVLKPQHLIRLEARGAPVSLLCAPASPFAKHDMVDGLLVGEGHGDAHRLGFPQAQDVMRALQIEATGLRHLSDEYYWEDSPSLLCGPIVQDLYKAVGSELGSELSRFVPVSLSWSSATHSAFPVAARQRAVEILMIGVALARGWGAEQSSGAARTVLPSLPIEIWVAFVIGHVVQRRSKPGGVGEGCKRMHMQAF